MRLEALHLYIPSMLLCACVDPAEFGPSDESGPGSSAGSSEGGDLGDVGSGHESSGPGDDSGDSATGGGDGTDGTDGTGGTSGDGDGDVPDPDTFTHALISHQFLGLGDSIDLSNNGRLVEIYEVLGDSVVRIDADTQVLECASSGMACLTLEWERLDDIVNSQIQTACVICYDEIGGCQGGTPLPLNLEAMLQSGAAGDADPLGAGSGAFSAVCEVGDALTVGLGTPVLPPPLMKIHDRYGFGEDRLDAEEIAWTRNAEVVSRSGETIADQWFVTFGSRADGVSVSEGGQLEFDGMDCTQDPRCTWAGGVIESGDVLVVEQDQPSAVTLDELIAAADAGPEVNQYVDARGLEQWHEASDLEAADAVRRVVLSRLVSIDVLSERLEAFATVHPLQDDVRIAWGGSSSRITKLPGLCSGATELVVCNSLEADLSDYEASTIAALKAHGYEIWSQIALESGPDGQPLVPPGFDAPAYGVTEGVVVTADHGGFLEEAITRAAAFSAFFDAMNSAGLSRDLILAPSYGPEAWGEACTQAPCESEFEPYQLEMEALINGAKQHFEPASLQGFAIPGFDGRSFDYTMPHTAAENRTANVGFNNPMLFPYLVR